MKKNEKKYYSVLFADNTETIVSKSVLTGSSPIILKEFSSIKDGEVILVNAYDLKKRKESVTMNKGYSIYMPFSLVKEKHGN